MFIRCSSNYASEICCMLVSGAEVDDLVCLVVRFFSDFVFTLLGVSSISF